MLQLLEFHVGFRTRRPPRKERCASLEVLEERRFLAADGVLQESGDFATEVARLKDLVLGRDSYLYVAPTESDLASFTTLASTLLAGEVATAAAQAAALDYDLVEFTDTSTGNTLHELREQLLGGSPTRGWGTYVVNLGFQANSLIEVPHPLFDTNSWDLGAQAFQHSGARGFLMAGAHRHANGTGTADVAHLTDSVFERFHEAWNGLGGESTAWSVHGFNLANHDGGPGEDWFPADTDLVISNGDGSVSAEVVDLDTRLTTNGFLAYSYNTLDSSDPLNIQVNDGLDGTTFSSLAGSTNVQGVYSRAVGGTFVHAEYERSIRFDAANRQLAATLLSDSISAPITFCVAHAEVTATSTEGLQLSVDFNRAYDPDSLQATDLLVNGTTASALTLVDEDTAVFDLPPLVPGSYTAAFASGSIHDAGQIGINEFHLPFDAPDVPSGETATKFFVVDTATDQTYEYDAGGDLVESYSLSSRNTTARGAAADATGTTVWVMDNDDFVYVYDADGNLAGRWKAVGLSQPEGIATDGNDIWIVDRGTDRVHVFAGAADYRNGSFKVSASFSLAADNSNPRGITTDGIHIWVVNWANSSDKVFKYTVDGILRGSWTIDSRNDSPRGITVDPQDSNNLWIVDNASDAIYQYLGGGNRTSGSQTADAVFLLDTADSNPQGIADPPPPQNIAAEPVQAEPVGQSRPSLGGVPRQASAIVSSILAWELALAESQSWHDEAWLDQLLGGPMANWGD